MAETTIDVCVCTFRRPSIADTIRSIGDQQLPSGVHLRLIVADNDTAPTAQAVAAQAAGEAGLPLTYVHAPARNISIARNACLDATVNELVAFIDDDEIAEPGWLAALLETMTSQRADVVFGRVRAVYDQALPRWVARADLHSIEPVVLAGGRIETGYTANVLFRRRAAGEHRFDPALGITGGEDDVFFSRLSSKGALLAYSRDAVVAEAVSPKRGNMRWLTQRAFRSGQTFGSVLIERRQSRPAAIARTGAKVAYCAASATITLASPVAWRRATVRGALHLGVLARLLGKREIEIY